MLNSPPTSSDLGSDSFSGIRCCLFGLANAFAVSTDHIVVIVNLLDLAMASYVADGSLMLKVT